MTKAVAGDPRRTALLADSRADATACGAAALPTQSRLRRCAAPPRRRVTVAAPFDRNVASAMAGASRPRDANAIVPSTSSA